MRAEEPHTNGRGVDAKGQRRARGEGSRRVHMHAKVGRMGRGRRNQGGGACVNSIDRLSVTHVIANLIYLTNHPKAV